MDPPKDEVEEGGHDVFKCCEIYFPLWLKEKRQARSSEGDGVIRVMGGGGEHLNSVKKLSPLVPVSLVGC